VSNLFPNPLILGSRVSPLALIQAEVVKSAILKTCPYYSESMIKVKTFKTLGDKILDQKLSEIGGKGLFTKELEVALLEKEIHIAVHSMKDVATDLPDGLEIGAILAREKPEDALIAKQGINSLEDLPCGAKIGTSSLRRIAQIKCLRPDLECVNLRGNIDTRLKKIETGTMDGILLARAGLIRRGIEDKINYVFPVDKLLPAPAQGAIGLELLSTERDALARIIALLHSQETALAIRTERAFLEALDGSCKTPIAAHAYFDEKKDHLIFQGEIYAENGSEFHIEKAILSKKEAVEKARKLGQDLRKTLPSIFWPHVS